MFMHTVRLLTLVMIVLFASCEGLNEKPDGSSAGKGFVTLELKTQIDIKSPQSLSEVEDYNFRFVGLDGYSTSDLFRFGDVSWPMEWYYGIYRVEAENCSETEAESGYGCLRYAGISEPFAIINGCEASAWLLCSIANVRVSVNYDNAMFESFDSFRLDVEALTYAENDDSEDEEEQTEPEEVLRRSLPFDSGNSTGFYNLYDTPMYLRYTLYILMDGAEEAVPVKTGFLSDASDVPLILKAGDDVTFNVSYTGAPMVSPNIKFIVSGERISVENGLEVPDYEYGSVVEDK